MVQDLIYASYSYLSRLLCGNAAQDLVMTVGFAGCTSFAMVRVVTGEKSIGSLIVFITYWSTIKSTTKRAVCSYQAISSTLISAERLLRLLYTEPSVTNAESPKELLVNAGEVEVKSISLAYNPPCIPLIERLDLVAAPGKTVAIVGTSGSRKSTIFKLLFRLYVIQEGSITTDGQNLKEVTLSNLRRAIGIVPQSPMLFNRSILENVRYGRLNATDEDTVDVCKAAAIHEKIMGFPDKYKAKVGEGDLTLWWRASMSGHRSRSAQKPQDFFAR